jgi:hypothetical protein
VGWGEAGLVLWWGPVVEVRASGSPWVLDSAKATPQERTLPVATPVKPSLSATVKQLTSATVTVTQSLTALPAPLGELLLVAKWPGAVAAGLTSSEEA